MTPARARTGGLGRRLALGAGLALALCGSLESLAADEALRSRRPGRPLPRFEARFRMRGCPVRVLGFDGGVTTGRVQGIDVDGSLLLVDDSGAQTRVVAGDVTLDKEAP